MKSSTICIILILSITCHRSHSVSIAAADSMVSIGNPDLHNVEGSHVQEPLARSRRHLGLSLCIYCCKCCRYKGCGYCCRT
ncbi:hepcidin-2-like [Engystomops pustulosus]|uniref:hepcidin-2-like n=1 Tax=Engystomops pustulosus TaxID=76066 RepID=UPI003AFA81D7